MYTRPHHLAYSASSPQVHAPSTAHPRKKLLAIAKNTAPHAHRHRVQFSRTAAHRKSAALKTAWRPLARQFRQASKPAPAEAAAEYRAQSHQPQVWLRLARVKAQSTIKNTSIDGAASRYRGGASLLCTIASRIYPLCFQKSRRANSQPSKGQQYVHGQNPAAAACAAAQLEDEKGL